MIFTSIKWWPLILVFPILPSSVCESEQLISCGENVPCKGKNTPNEALEQYLLTLSRSDSYCDANCTLFGDCFWDKALYPNDGRGEWPWTCIQLSLNQSVYAFVSCEHELGGLKRSCGKCIAKNDYHNMMDIPVYSYRTRIYYANISIRDKLNQMCKLINCTHGLNCSIESCNNSEQNYLINKNLENFAGNKVNKYIICIGMSVSVVCLLLHMFISIFSTLPNSSSTKMFDTLSFCMLLAQILFMYNLFPFIDLPDLMCYMLGIMIQFFNIASFFWMNAVSIDIYYTFSNTSLKYTAAKKHYKFALYAWLSAGVVTAALVLADLTDILPTEYRPNLAAKKNICWFGSRKALIIFFYVPASFLVLLNLLLFLETVYWLQKQRRSSEVLKKSGKKEYNRLWLYMKLSTIMGLCHVFGLIKLLTNNMTYRYIFHSLVTLQGAFIFIMFHLKTDGNWVLLTFRRLQQKQNTGNYNRVTFASLMPQSRNSIICQV